MKNKMPELNSVVVVETPSISPGSESLLGSDDSGLEVPSHIPSYESAESKNSSLVTPPAPKKGIEVEALRKGFYNQHRLKEGEKFTVKTFEELGEWMKCTDPDLQKKHYENLKIKKALK